MKISVIIPCYNAARYLPECLASVSAQTLRDYEVIIIDDGSTDDTARIAESAAEEDGRIRVIRQKNAGVSAARNAGLDCAAGEFVTFVDGDDLLAPDALEVMLNAASEGVDMVICAHQTFDDAGREVVFVPETRWMDLRGEAQRRAAALRLIEGDSVLNIMCNKLHRRALIERERIRLTPGLKIAEDALFNLEAVLAGNGMVYVNRVTYRYRMHALSATHKTTGSTFEAHTPWFAAMRSLLERRGVMEAYYTAFLDTVALRLYKDGGVGGVIRGFNASVRPQLPQEMDEVRLSAGARILRRVVLAGLYPAVYPLIYPIQVLRRKWNEAAFRLRAGKECPR